VIRAAFRAAEPPEQARLAQLLSEKWQTARESGDPFALQQLEQRWRTVPWMRRQLLDDAEAIFLGSSSLSRELALLSVAHGERNPVGNAAFWRLRDEWQLAGFPRDAADIEYRLLRERPGELVAPEKTVRQQFGGDALARPRRIADPWPVTSPQIATTKEMVNDAQQTPVPIDSDADTIWDRINVSVNHQGRILRFTGDGRQGGWTFELPKGLSALQQYPLSYQAWGRGRLLLVRIGTVLMAVSPWNEHDEPVARIIWSQELLASKTETHEQVMVERIPSPWKHAREDYRITNHLSREVGAVGPVCAGHVCFQQQGKLITLETLTGRLLWERWDLPPGIIVLGDENTILLWSPDDRTCEFLDAADGRTLRRDELDFSSAEVWHRAASRVWLGRTEGDELTLSCRELVSDKTLWQRSFVKESLPIALDHRLAAVIDPRGLLHFLELETGALLDEPLTVAWPQPIERIFVSRDEERWYLGVSGPVERALDWLATQPLTGYRRPLLHGPLIALERTSRQIVWTRPVAGEPWLLDQNSTTPVLVQMFKTPPPPGSQAVGEGVLRLIDKRTGRDVFVHRDLNVQPYYSLDPQPEFGRFDVRLQSTKFRIDYTLPEPE
jgi:hypothetical protein